jgi:parvulin-like peptidyl-prolyl isomerase
VTVHKILNTKSFVINVGRVTVRQGLSQGNANNDEPEPEGNIWMTLLGAAAGAALGAVSAFAAPAVGNSILGGVGFTENGVAKKSLASRNQSRHGGDGNVRKDSFFSTLQSKGAKGGFESPGAVSVIASALGGALAGGAVGEAVRQGQNINQNRNR